MFTLGTAGHIDHGKTTLVRHLTGVDTDRLAEEKRRGISIELGFAQLTTPRGIGVGIVDVPGHERFIRTMVAGVSGIDAALFVVAADEGVMPQTREHFDILRLMGVEDGVVALTKCDVADEDLRAIVRDDLGEFFAGTPLARATVVETSPSDPSSYDRLRAAVDELLERLVPRRQSGHFRMPVDRVFSIHGHGTIVTGTVTAGSIARGAEVELQPEGLVSRIRSIQVFGASTDDAHAGQRAALNLPDAATSVVGRGSTCCTPGVFRPTSMVDARIELLGNLPPSFATLRHGTRVRLYLGTAEAIGRVHLMDCDELGEGCSALVQFRLERAIVAARGDRFLVRTFSPLVTIAGGTVLDPQPRRHRNRAEASVELRRMAEADPSELVLGALEGAPAAFLTRSELALLLSLPQSQVDPHLPPEEPDTGILRFETGSGELFCAERRLLAERGRLLAAVEEHHRREPASPGMDRASLQQRAASALRLDAFNLVLGQLLDAGDLVRTGKLVARSGFAPRLEPALQRGLDLVRAALARDGELAWTPKALAEDSGLAAADLSRAIGILLNDGSLVRLPGGNFGLAERTARLREQTVALIRAAGGEADTNAIKEGLNLTRKHLIPFLEYLDETGVTLRVGNARRLRTP